MMRPSWPSSTVAAFESLRLKSNPCKGEQDLRAILSRFRVSTFFPFPKLSQSLQFPWFPRKPWVRMNASRRTFFSPRNLIGAKTCFCRMHFSRKNLICMLVYISERRLSYKDQNCVITSSTNAAFVPSSRSFKKIRAGECFRQNNVSYAGSITFRDYA